MSYKWWIVVAAVLFLVGIGIGLVTPNIPLAHELTSGLEELSRIIVPFSLLTVFIIFSKNALAMLMSFVLSPLLCLVPLLALVANGWLLGYISAAVVQKESLAFVLYGILPHGIFELPAMIMAQAAALGFGAAVLLVLFRKKSRPVLAPRVKRYVKFLVFAIILLVPAAFIETFITPLLLGK